MSAGLKYSDSFQSTQSRLYSVPRGSHSANRPIGAAQISHLPDLKVLPLWLRSLNTVQRSLSITTLLLTAAILAVYSKTVYSQHLWNQQYNKLQDLQHQERQLSTMTEGLKNQIARQAENSRMGLVPAAPANAIFMQPAPKRGVKPVPSSAPTAESVSTSPLGY